MAARDDTQSAIASRKLHEQNIQMRQPFGLPMGAKMLAKRLWHVHPSFAACMHRRVGAAFRKDDADCSAESRRCGWRTLA